MTVYHLVFMKTLLDACGGEEDGWRNMRGGEGEGPCGTCGRDERHDGKDERDRGHVVCKEQKDKVAGGNETLAFL
jgi:hypothetical protein